MKADVYTRQRLSGRKGDYTEYIIECLGDLDDAQVFSNKLAALEYLKRAYGYPDPEDDRILIWEVLPSGHKKVVWHFSGWHWDANEFYELEQGCYINEERCVYAISNDDD
jgi:hypothetical protein